jgi:hypothetical protein
MKRFFNAIPNKKFACLLFILSGFTLITSCKKHDDYDFESTVTANVRLVNASTDAGSSTLYISDVLRTPNAVSFGTNSGYNQTYVGQVDATVKTAGGTVLASTNTELDALGNYTFFLTGTAGSYAVINLPDDTQAAASGKVKIRFVQASSSLTNTVDMLSNGTALFTALTYKTVSSYSEVNAGAYIFAVTNAGSNTALASSASVNLQAGKNYTIYTYGDSAANGATALGIHILADN